METINDYTKQGVDFLNATNTIMTVKFLKHGKHFEDDKYDRDIYEIELKRGNRSYIFNFGQSINNSGEYQVRKELQNKLWCRDTTNGKICLNAKEFKALKHIGGIERDIFKNQNFAEPTAYDVLACLTDNDPGTFDNFCADFGYDTDSRKAEKVYKAVVNEWQNVAMLFTDAEIEQLQEIN